MLNPQFVCPAASEDVEEDWEKGCGCIMGKKEDE